MQLIFYYTRQLFFVNVFHEKYVKFYTKVYFFHHQGILIPYHNTKFADHKNYNNQKEMRDNMGSKFLDCTALTIVIIGAINWGLIGFLRFDLVAFLFGDMTLLSRIVYALVGICGLYLLTFYMKLGNKEEA